MKTRIVRLGLGLVLVLLMVSCVKDEPADLKINNKLVAFTGRWDNINAFTNSISRLVITRKEVNQITIQVWQACGQEQCELAIISNSLEDLNDGILSFYLDMNNEPVPLEIGLTTSEKLELRSADPPSSNFETQYFSKSKTSTFFQQISLEDARTAKLSRAWISGSHQGPNHLTPGTVLVYRTNEERFGKIQIRGNDERLTLRWHTWNTDGTTYGSKDYLAINGNSYFDMDLGMEDDTTEKILSDFFWSDQGKTKRWVEPQNGATFIVFHLE